MSLYKQLVLFISALFLILLSGTLLVNFSSTQRYLNDQLNVQVEDTATSLGLVLSPYFLDDDVSVMQTTVNAVFDRGYYKEISVIDAADDILVIRQQPVVVEGVPSWFISLINIDVPEALREVSSGWALTGDVKVVGHAGYAYQQLWRVFNNSLLWFLLAFLLLGFFGNKALRVLLQPLEAVRLQAIAICRREREEIPLPKTLELRTVVSAMNKMTRHVKGMFEEQASIAKNLQEIAYKDALTGLGNQRYFKNQLRNQLSEPDQFKPGVLFLLQCHNFGSFNNRNGYVVGDSLLVKISRILTEAIEGYEEVLIARISGSEFSIVIRELYREQACALAAQISHQVSQLFPMGLYDEPNVAHLSLLMVDQPQQPGEMLGKVDEALRHAQSLGENTWHLYEEGEADPLRLGGGKQWLNFLVDTIKEEKITLLVQKAVSSKNRQALLHNEVLVQIQGEGDEVYSAGQFLLSVEEMGMTVEIDRFVVKSMVDMLKRHFLTAPERPETFAINLSTSALNNAEFIDFMLQQLDQLPGADPVTGELPAKRIILEVTEAMAINNLEVLQKLSLALRKRGHGLGLDHFGRGFSNFGYLQTLKPDYVKIDRSYTRDIETTPDNQFFVSTLCNICRNLEIQLIALAVESESQQSCLRSLHVDGLQGYGIGMPQLLNPETV